MQNKCFIKYLHNSNCPNLAGGFLANKKFLFKNWGFLPLYLLSDISLC